MFGKVPHRYCGPGTKSEARLKLSPLRPWKGNGSERHESLRLRFCNLSAQFRASVRKSAETVSVARRNPWINGGAGIMPARCSKFIAANKQPGCIGVLEQRS
jgi:hypothetical protein